MCLGFPGRVVDLDAGGAVVDVEGRRRRASTLLVPDVAVGDWVYVTAGTIVDRIDPAEAVAIRSTLLEAIARMDAPWRNVGNIGDAGSEKEDRR